MERSETVRRLQMAKEILLLPEIPGVDEFDMGWWGSAESLDKDGNTCGTVCCFGGALGLQPAFRALRFIAEWRKVSHPLDGDYYVLDARYEDGDWREFEEMGAEVFGISVDECGELFADYATELCPEDFDDCASDVTREIVEHRLDVLIERYSMPEAA